MTVTSSILAFASQTFPRTSSRVLASSGYSRDIAKFGPPEVFGVWSEETAERQDRAWQPIVDAAKKGRPREDVAALDGAIASLRELPRTLLEVGCGGGYNSELIVHAFPGIAYTGIDISSAMIGLARAHYPGREFEVASAYDLPQDDDSVDVVVDGVALIHMPGWRRALPEYARVSAGDVILHGLTLTDASPTTEFAKYAYGQPALEYVFNRDELLAICRGLGLELVHTEGGLDYDLKRYIGVESVSETWVLSPQGG
jgi:SAM-dependent methyltransferase